VIVRIIRKESKGASKGLGRVFKLSEAKGLFFKKKEEY